ncbi:hypothetical protein [Streptomyces erythrochromogenes]|uniref:hypothetical protein n=1 Tax=Streptomyces erythrochromogenes TaxID=285574 RepID=UPI0037001BC0
MRRGQFFAGPHRSSRRQRQGRRLGRGRRGRGPRAGDHQERQNRFLLPVPCTGPNPPGLHWTSELVRDSRLERVSGEEKARIESELGIADIGSLRFGRFACRQGHEFSAFDFLRHGIREHGQAAVQAIFELKNAAFLRVNPYFAVNCATCDQPMEGGITYEGDTYAGCSYPDPPVCR